MRSEVEEKRSGRARVAASVAWRLVRAGTLLTFIAIAGRYAFELVLIWQGSLRESRTPFSAALNKPLLFTQFGAEDADTVALRLAAKPVTIFVYSRRCVACAENMPRWFDMAAELQREGSSADIYAIGVDEDSTGAAYWRFLPQVRVMRPVDQKAFVDALGLKSTPTTIVIDLTGSQLSIVGILGPHRRQRLRTALRAG